MITVTRLSGDIVIVNANQIEFVEMTPDTLISLVSGKKLMVKETVAEVISRIVDYQRQIGQGREMPYDETSEIREYD